MARYRRSAISYIKLAEARVGEAQPKAVKALFDALDAVTSFPRIIGRDKNGHPEYEYVQVPDHHVRVKAAAILLNKRIPDVVKQQHEGKDGGAIKFVFTKVDKEL